MPINPWCKNFPEKWASVDMCTHYSELLLYWRIKSVVVNLLPSAVISMNIFEDSLIIK
ncbi:hypothetical protein I79_004329 [Cricetulus griseus]|uniref:Uncharacterized protein n=1 Tax=Cricetulus griseus TaxID=10029 RepID=G3H2C1_CRIGR|nr:hypothetical protein I79_004329 [Cricetulus griseus]